VTYGTLAFVARFSTRTGKYRAARRISSLPCAAISSVGSLDILRRRTSGRYQNWPTETDAEMRASSSILRYGDRAARHTCPVFARISCQTAKSRKNKDLLAGARGFEPRHSIILSRRRRYRGGFSNLLNCPVPSATPQGTAAQLAARSS